MMIKAIVESYDLKITRNQNPRKSRIMARHTKQKREKIMNLVKFFFSYNLSRLVVLMKIKAIFTSSDGWNW